MCLCQNRISKCCCKYSKFCCFFSASECQTFKASPLRTIFKAVFFSASVQLFQAAAASICRKYTFQDHVPSNVRGFTFWWEVGSPPILVQFWPVTGSLTTVSISFRYFCLSPMSFLISSIACSSPSSLLSTSVRMFMAMSFLLNNLVVLFDFHLFLAGLHLVEYNYKYRNTICGLHGQDLFPRISHWYSIFCNFLSHFTLFTRYLDTIFFGWSHFWYQMNRCCLLNNRFGL